jgi:8-oxo-dGTP pyrophosphatase MutT (NUDIX family)
LDNLEVHLTGQGITLDHAPVSTEQRDIQTRQAPEAARRRALRPRDAATLIVVDSSSGEPRILLGRRRADVVFMPGKYVFPGGRVDAADRRLAASVSDDLKDGNLRRLLVDMKGNASVQRARALALAAVRETFEETGLIIGTPLADVRAHVAPAWEAFFAQGFAPALRRLTFFARAITPPGRPRRYDTRFFCVPADAIARRIQVLDGELSELEWHPIAQARLLQLPNITRVVIEDLGERLACGALESCDEPVPFYHRRSGTFRRDLIGLDSLLD